MSTMSISQAMDLAVEKMNPLRRAAMKRRLQNATYRNHAMDELAAKLLDDDDACHLAPALVACSSSETFTARTSWEFDPANLEKFLEIVLKYLPQILELILKFLPLFTCTLLSAFLPSSASAQCVGGVCQLPARAIRAAANVASIPSRALESMPRPLDCVSSHANSQVSISVQSSANSHSDAMAASGRLYHSRGGGVEGVGYSSRSAADAVRNCCYWGRRQAVLVSVSHGRRGYYAVVRYR